MPFNEAYNDIPTNVDRINFVNAYYKNFVVSARKDTLKTSSLQIQYGCCYTQLSHFNWLRRLMDHVFLFMIIFLWRISNSCIYKLTFIALLCNNEVMLSTKRLICTKYASSIIILQNLRLWFSFHAKDIRL